MPDHARMMISIPPKHAGPQGDSGGHSIRWLGNGPREWGVRVRANLANLPIEWRAGR